MEDQLDPILDLMDGTKLPVSLRLKRKRALVQVVHICGNYMINVLKDFRRSTARELADMVVKGRVRSYETLFNTEVMSRTGGNSLKKFSQAIYAFVNSNKGDENKRKNRKKGSYPAPS